VFFVRDDIDPRPVCIAVAGVRSHCRTVDRGEFPDYDAGTGFDRRFDIINSVRYRLNCRTLDGQQKQSNTDEKRYGPFFHCLPPFLI
jgi:hypothetical protein